MLFVDTAGSAQSDFDAVLCLVSQLRGHGLPATVHTSSVPDDLSAAQEFDLSPFVTSATPSNGDRAIIIRADQLDGEGQIKLRARYGRHGVKCVAFGSLDDRQSFISAQSRLAYIFGSEPELHATPPILDVASTGTPVFGAAAARRPERTNQPRILLVAPDTEDPSVAAKICALGLESAFEVELLLSGKAKSAWRASYGQTIPVWHLGELMPRALAARYDGAILFQNPSSWPRMQMFVANIVAAGAFLGDGTLDRSWNSASSTIIAAPSDPASLSHWLATHILPNLAALKGQVKASELARELVIPAALRQLAPPPSVLADRQIEPDARRIVFMPTNGVGLGHAKRCSLVAHEMRDRADPVFASFPSCIGMLAKSGFDTMPLIGRTQLRPSNSNDLINHARLDAMTKGVGGLVFDGGYVFDSVMRASADNGIPSIWIRRGLSQPNQNNAIAEDREKVFDSILVPTEIFDELNGPAERSERVRRVGPIVHRVELGSNARDDIRSSLKSTLGIDGDKLVVTMLGGGVAADRKAQVNALAAHLSTRPDVMHVVVVWPTATTDPSWFNHANTRVVQTIHAGVLVQAADLFVSAVGYNSFHEAIYGSVPTIFVPQMASYMDDQRARGTAAVDRGIALMAEPWELLRLARLVDQCLEGQADDLRSALSKINLPETGHRAAADHILEVFS